MLQTIIIKSKTINSKVWESWSDGELSIAEVLVHVRSPDFSVC